MFNDMSDSTARRNFFIQERFPDEERGGRERKQRVSGRLREQGIEERDPSPAGLNREELDIRDRAHGESATLYAAPL
jgi:hypothetical protein